MLPTLLATIWTQLNNLQRKTGLGFHKYDLWESSFKIFLRQTSHKAFSQILNNCFLLLPTALCQTSLVYFQSYARLPSNLFWNFPFCNKALKRRQPERFTKLLCVFVLPYIAVIVSVGVVETSRLCEAGFLGNGRKLRDIAVEPARTPRQSYSSVKHRGGNRSSFI